MNDATGMTRRYHWLGDAHTDFINEPHTAVCYDHRGYVLDFFARENKLSRLRFTELAELPEREPEKILSRHPNWLCRAATGCKTTTSIRNTCIKSCKRLTNKPRNTSKPCCKFRASARKPCAHGGKDGTPFPVDRDNYDKIIEILHATLGRTKIERSKKIQALKRLAEFR